MTDQCAIACRVAEEAFKEKGMRVNYLVGAMIEPPSAALVASEIAKEAEFSCFGTNDLPLVKMAIERGRETRPTLRVGICGEHGGEPSSVEFCHQAGLN
jgi:pyruvate,orthophosphate dikinase